LTLNEFYQDGVVAHSVQAIASDDGILPFLRDEFVDGQDSQQCQSQDLSLLELARRRTVKEADRTKSYRVSNFLTDIS
jgi:hypothetical protein